MSAWGMGVWRLQHLYSSVTEFPYLTGYAASLHDQVRPLLLSGELRERLALKYPQGNRIINDGLLRDYALSLKNRFLKRSPPLSKICFDDKISSLQGALGLHSFVSRVQGGRTKAKNELRVASLMKQLPEEFVRMVVVHELAHLKEKDHNKSFYQLCLHMEADYHRLEFDLRLYLTAHLVR
jgi:predicted metal-dependent hydrolase